jgi:hypothetical protein
MAANSLTFDNSGVVGALHFIFIRGLMIETLSQIDLHSAAMESILEVDNPAEILRNQDGVFEVTSPYGHVFEVTCKRGSKMGIREIDRPEQAIWGRGLIWRIRKLKSH